MATWFRSYQVVNYFGNNNSKNSTSIGTFQKEERLTSGCSPSPRPSPHSSARCVPAEPRVMLLATEVVEANLLPCNTLVTFEVEELRPRKEQSRNLAKLWYTSEVRKS